MEFYDYARRVIIGRSIDFSETTTRGIIPITTDGLAWIAGGHNGPHLFEMGKYTMAYGTGSSGKKGGNMGKTRKNRSKMPAKRRMRPMKK